MPIRPFSFTFTEVKWFERQASGRLIGASEPIATPHLICTSIPMFVIIASIECRIARIRHDLIFAQDGGLWRRRSSQRNAKTQNTFRTTWPPTSVSRNSRPWKR